MINCSDIITRAARRIGVLAAGQLLSDNEAYDALETLQSMYQRVISEGSLGQIRDVIAQAGDMIAQPNTRITRLDETNTSITLPTTFTQSGSYHTHLPVGGSVIIVNDTLDNTSQTFIYDGEVSQWLPITGLDLTSPAPLATRDSTGLAAYLATEMADEYGMEISPALSFAASRWHSNVLMDWSREPVLHHHHHHRRGDFLDGPSYF